MSSTRIHGKKILVVSATRKSKTNQKNIRLLEGLKLLKKDVDVKIHYLNEDPLPKVYNQYINEKTLAKHDIVAFVHDDVYIDDLKFRGKLCTAVNSGLDIVGVAGCINPTISVPALWHLMADKKDHRGFCAHSIPKTNAMHMTTFGPTPSRVAFVDGVFMAVNLKEAIDKDWKFNENFAFHHYDLSSCLDANAKKMKIGVFPIHIIHDSPGLDPDDETFIASEKKFMEIYG